VYCGGNIRSILAAHNLQQMAIPTSKTTMADSLAESGKDCRSSKSI
jgi:hypothetical protein